MERPLLPSTVFLIFAECRPQLKARRSLLEAVCHRNVAGKAQKKRKKTASFVASLRWRTAAIERTTCDLSCLSTIRDNLLLHLWPSQRKPRHWGESTGKSDQDSVTDKVPSVLVSCGWFESCSCWFLESASDEVKQRENDEKRNSLMHFIVFCGKQNILLRAHPNEKVGQQQLLASAVQVMVLELCCLTRKQDLQGIHCFA